MRVLVLNPGSATLKATVLDPPDRAPRFERTIGWSVADEGSGRGLAIAAVLAAMADAGVPASSIEVVGYRVVHGGDRFRDAILVDDDVVAAIDALGDLAPLHNPIAAETIRAGRAAIDGVPHVAVFDTAFHATMPEAARRYPVPEHWTADLGVRRYGFHGLSVAWSVQRTAELLDRPVDELRLVVAHLGGGCSVTAVDGGRSVATSMGMTPLEGLMMGTRAGSIDPGIIVRLARAGATIDTIADELEHASGLLGVAGTADVRQLLAAELDGDRRAALALEMFVDRAAAGVAAAATSLQALDALIFTAGIGEHAAPIRSRIVARLAVLGLPTLDDAPDGGTDLVLAGDGGQPAVLRITAREDLVIAAAAGALARSSR
jgi:acetate kinase